MMKKIIFIVGSLPKIINTLTLLLGLIVEEVTKESFDSYCKVKILEPLEMGNSSWYNNEINPKKQVIQYARVSKDTVINNLISNLVKKPVGDFLKLCNYSFYNYPDGLFKTSVDDLSRFLETIMNKGRYKNFKLLKETTISKC